MHKNFLNFFSILFFLFAFPNSSFSQIGGNILIYSNKNDFLVPFIKTTLEEMVNKESNNKIFSNATILNLLFVNTNEDKLLRSALDYKFPNKSFRAIQNKSLEDSIFNIFIKNDYFLLVNENTLQDKIEFQLVLYKIIKDTSKISDQQNDFPIKKINNQIAENNFFVDISSNDYLSILRSGVKKMIPESNSRISFKISTAGNLNRLDQNRLTSSLNDTLSFGISDIRDENNPFDQLKFKITIIPELNLNNNSFSILKINDVFKVKFDSTGKYKIFISSFDGISTTNSDTFNLEIINIPKILSLIKEINRIYVLNWFSFANKITYKIPIYISGNDPGFNFNINFKSSQKSPSQILKDYKRKNKIYDINPFYVLPKMQSQKIDSNLYLIKVIEEYNAADSFLNVYGISNGLRSNIENIRLKSTPLYPFSIKPWIENNSLRVEKNKCNCGTDSTANFQYTSIYPLSFQYKLYSKDYFSLGFVMSIGSTITSYKRESKFYPFNQVSGMVNSYNLTVSHLFSTGDIFIDLNLGINAKSIYIRSDSSNQYNSLQFFRNFGPELLLNFSFLRFKGVGILADYNLGWGKSDGLKFKSSNFGFGLSYTPISKR